MRFLFILLFLSIRLFSQNTISGTVYDEEQNPIPAVLVMNMKSGYQTYTDPDEKISEFISFSFGQNPQIIEAVKAKNISKVMFLLEEIFPVYLQRLESN